MAPDPDDDMLAEQLFEAARRERSETGAKQRALRAVSGPRPALGKPRWFSVAAAAGALALLVFVGQRIGFKRGDGAGGGPEAGRIRAEPVEVSAGSPVIGSASARPLAQSRSGAERAVSSGTPVLASSSSSAPAPVSHGPRRGAAPKDVPASLEQELELLDRARQALLTGDTSTALTRLAHYERVATRRRLGAEATVLRVQILAASGRATEASLLAREFVAKHPNSPLVDRAKSFVRESTSGQVNQGVGP